MEAGHGTMKRRFFLTKVGKWIEAINYFTRELDGNSFGIYGSHKDV